MLTRYFTLLSGVISPLVIFLSYRDIILVTPDFIRALAQAGHGTMQEIMYLLRIVGYCVLAIVLVVSLVEIIYTAFKMRKLA